MAESKIDKNIKSWEPLLEGLDVNKKQLYKFSRIYENTFKNNSEKDLKFLISILYRVFKESKQLNVSRKSSNKIEILSFDENDIYFDGKIMIDMMLSFVDAISKMIVEKLNEENSLNYIKAEKKGAGNYVIKIIY